MDDIIITRNHPAAIDLLIGKLKTDFALKDLGALSYFLGIQAVRNFAGLHLKQSKYILDLLHRVNMTDCKPSPTPCIAGSEMSTFDGGPFKIPLNLDM